MNDIVYTLNNNSENISEYINSTFEGKSTLIIATLPFKILMILLTIFLNFMIILSNTIQKKDKTFSTYLLLSITISDLIVGCFSMSFMTIFTYYAYWPLGYILCAFWVIVDYSTSTVNLISIFILTFQRFLLIKYPFAVSEKLTNLKIAIIFIPWILGFSYWIVSVVIITNNDTFDYINCYFTSTFIYVITSDIIAFFLPIILITIFSILTIYELNLKRRKTNLKKKQKLELSISNNFSSVKQTGSKSTGSKEKKYTFSKEEKAVLCITILTINIILLWGIFLVSWPLYAICNYCVDMVVMEIGYWFTYLPSTTNPIILLIFNKHVRKNIIKFILFKN